MDTIRESRKALKRVSAPQIATTLAGLRTSERVFCVGNGGGAAHAAHFAADLRKIVHKSAFAADNFGEMTARINDDGWEHAWYGWLADHHYSEDRGDLVFAFSCGGRQDGVSQNLPIYRWGIGGARSALSILVPSTSTPVIEGCQAVIAHHLVDQLCA